MVGIVSASLGYDMFWPRRMSCPLLIVLNNITAIEHNMLSKVLFSLV